MDLHADNHTAGQGAVGQRAERVARMERALNESREAVDQARAALERLEAVVPGLAELGAYYGSQLWFCDRAADEAGELGDMPRGVLSEDAAYDLLADAREAALCMAESSAHVLRCL